MAAKGGHWNKSGKFVAAGGVTVQPASRELSRAEKIDAATGLVSVQTDYKDWSTNNRLSQDPSPSDLNYKLGKPLKWNPAKKAWEGDAAGTRRLINRLRAEAENLRDWASGRQSVNARERLAHAQRLLRVASKLEDALLARIG